MSVAKYLVEILQEAKEKLYPQKQFLNYIKGLVYCFYECGSNMKPTQMKYIMIQVKKCIFDKNIEMQFLYYLNHTLPNIK